MKLIIVEGADGTGKTTLASNLERSLTSKGINVKLFREPWDDPSGKLIRELLRRGELLDPLPELMLFLSSRASLMRELERYLNQDVILISDRSYISSLVYQGLLRGLGWELVRELNRIVCPQWYRPDLVLVTHVPIQVLKERLSASLKNSSYDRMKLQDLERLLEAYRMLPELLPNLNVKLIDTSASQEEALSQALSALRELGVIT